MIASTAKSDADVLVTAGKRLRNQAAKAGITVWGWEEFRDAVLGEAERDTRQSP